MLGLRLLNPDWGGGAEEPEGWMKNSLNEETLSFGPNEQVPRGR